MQLEDGNVNVVKKNVVEKGKLSLLKSGRGFSRWKTVDGRAERHSEDARKTKTLLYSKREMLTGTRSKTKLEVTEQQQHAGLSAGSPCRETRH